MQISENILRQALGIVQFNKLQLPLKKIFDLTLHYLPEPLLISDVIELVQSYITKEKF